VWDKSNHLATSAEFTNPSSERRGILHRHTCRCAGWRGSVVKTVRVIRYMTYQRRRGREYEGGGRAKLRSFFTLALARHQSLSRALSLESVQMFVKFVMIMISNTILQTSNSIHLKTAPALSQNPVYQILHARFPRWPCIFLSRSSLFGAQMQLHHTRNM